MQFKIFKGTPNHSTPSLCFSCAHSHVFSGQAVSSMQVRCEAVYGEAIWLKEPIVDCSQYRRHNDSTLDEMKKMAWILETKKGRVIGFSPNAAHKQKLQDGDIDSRTQAEAHEVEDDV